MKTCFMALLFVGLSYGFANAVCCPVDSCYDVSDSVWTDSCCVLLGDVNNSGAVNGSDVVYLSNFFRNGINAPIPLVSCESGAADPYYMSADVNGSCTVNGPDLTYLVNYFSGGPAPVCCSGATNCVAYYP